MFDEVLIESAHTDKKHGTWITALISGIIHTIAIVAIIAAGVYVNENPEVIEKPISAFMVSAPPPPPPPPPANNGGVVPTRPRVETQREPREAFTQPSEVREAPEVASTNEDTGAEPGGVPGGQKGGQAGGVLGGEIGGQLGGELGGKVGGQLGGTGNVPLQVGGNVKAPIAVLRVDPMYTETARKARVQGVVILEAVIDRQGNVTEARILKGLPFGLDQSALAAIKRWKFQPGTMNGQPVPVYYNLTINFRLE